MLGSEYKNRYQIDKNIEKQFLKHIRLHKQMKQAENQLYVQQNKE